MHLNAVSLGQGGEPLVLLHGLFGQARNWAGVQQQLAARRQVVALDLRNHGGSAHDPAMDYAVMAEDVAATLAGMGLGPVALLGHSMGGKVAMRLALTRPALLARLVVADIAPVVYPPRIARTVAAMQAVPLRPGLTRREADAALAAAGVAEAGVRGFLLLNLRLDGAVPAWRIGLAEIGGAMPAIEGFPDPGGATYGGPMLVLAGERSDYIRDVDHARFRALFPAARFETMASAGHWLHADDPGGFVAAVERFLG
jgi:pimeloyl-ACP methyl ester carboxylesterase